jgi:hypothetical protein
VAVVRHPHRWPTIAVLGNQLFLPLFAGGQLPERREQLAVVDAIQAGRTIDPTGVTTFAELAARVNTATYAACPYRRLRGARRSVLALDHQPRNRQS